MLAVFWTQTAFAIVIVACRFYCRSVIKVVGADDWAMLATLVRCSWAFDVGLVLNHLPGHAYNVLWHLHGLCTQWWRTTPLLSRTKFSSGTLHTQAQLDMPALRDYESGLGENLGCLPLATAHWTFRESKKSLPLVSDRLNLHLQHYLLYLDLCAVQSCRGSLGSYSGGRVLGSGYSR